MANNDVEGSTIENLEKVDPEELRLKQNVGLIRGMSIVIGTMIGSGIFIFPQSILLLTGSVGLCLVVWTTGGLMAFLGSMTYAEVGTVVMKSGGSYAYLRQCYGPLVAFLFLWTGATIVLPSALAVSGLAFAQYLLPLASFCGGALPPVTVKLCAVAMIVTLTVINSQSTNVAAPVQVLCTVFKMAALLVIVFGGFVRMAQGHTSELSSGFAGTTDKVSNIALAFYAVNYSFAGWENIYMIFEEVKNPKRTLLVSGGMGVLIVTIVYLFANLSYLTAMSKMQLFTSPAVALTWGEEGIGSASLLIPIAVVISVFGSASSTMFAGARVMFAAGRDQLLPEFFSFIHITKRSPLPSILFNAALAIVFVIPSDIAGIIRFLSLPISFFKLLSVTALFILRKTKPHAPRFIKVPLLFPVLIFLYDFFLVVVPLVLQPQMEFLYATVFVLAGVLFYVPFVHFKLKPRLLDAVEVRLQMILHVSPPTTCKGD